MVNNCFFILGGFSKVFEVIDKKTNIKRALKCIKKMNQKDFSEKVLREVRILKTLVIFLFFFFSY